MLEVRGITRSYTSSSGEKRVILDRLNLTVQEGERVAIVGPSGSGKTTLLNLLGALDRPDSGEILIDGEPVYQKNEKELALFRNRCVGFVFQFHHLLPQLNLLENVLVPALAQKSTVDQESLQRAERLINRLGLAALKHQKPGQLSGGECQRTAVARALINKPRILLADEPTGALDKNSSAQLTKMLLELNQDDRVSLIVVTHSMELASKMDKIYQLVDGKLQSAGL
ncbi:ABC transporter ATP-binding protein [Gaoshiqia sp. Z1-71]|uniref:ABC transporter ATP-binding protein n=1 Tax=Gaoshiqia hydrogeniformans TaxID=3290090 RepID=UPI003BF7C299